MKPCKQNSMIDCEDNCYSCNGCGWSKQEQENRHELIQKGCMKKRDGLLALRLNRAKPKRKHINDAEVKRLCEDGRSVAEIAEILGHDASTVRRSKTRVDMKGSMTRNKKYKVSKDGVEIARGTAQECAKAAGVTSSTIHKAFHTKQRRDGLKVEAL